MDVDLLNEKIEALSGRFPHSVTTLFDLRDVTPPDRQWLWEDLVPEEVVVLLGGPPGSGKSLLAQQMCMAMATGSELFGYAVKTVPTLYITCEDSMHELHRRGLAIAACMGLQPYDLTDFYFDSWINETNTLLEGTEKLEQLRALVLQRQIKLLVLDLLPDFWDGNEIDRSQVNHFVKGVLGSFAAQTGCTVVVLHHPSKSGKADGTGTSGSTAWEGSVRQRLYLKEPDSFGVRSLEVMKSNQGSTFKVTNLHWKRFTDQAGAFVTTEQAVQPQENKLGIHEKPFLDAIPEEGIDHSAHRALVSEERCDRKAYSKAKINLQKKGLLMIEGGIFYRRDTPQIEVFGADFL